MAQKVTPSPTAALQAHFAAVRLFDKGSYHGAALRGIPERGGFFVIPWPHGVSVWETGPEGEPVAVDLASRWRHHVGEPLVLANVRLGQGGSALSGVRLVAYRFGEESTNRRRAALREKCRTHGRTPSAEALALAGWVILVTNVPAQKLPVRALGYLYRLHRVLGHLWDQVLKSARKGHQKSRKTTWQNLCEQWLDLVSP